MTLLQKLEKLEVTVAIRDAFSGNSAQSISYRIAGYIVKYFLASTLSRASFCGELIELNLIRDSLEVKLRSLYEENVLDIPLTNGVNSAIMHLTYSEDFRTSLTLYAHIIHAI